MSAEAPTTVESRWAAVRSRNGGLYFASQTVSTVGTFMQSFAQAWLVLELTGNRSSLPLSIALQSLPLLLFGTYGGALVDRVDIRRLLLSISALNAALAIALGVLVQTDRVDVVLVYLFCVLTGFVTVVERPATQAFIAELVSPDRIQSAVGLNSMIFPTARLLGPPLAGITIATAGLAWCFFLNAVTFVVFGVALLMLHRHELIARRLAPARKGMVAAGLRYARSDAIVGQALALMFVVGFAGFNFIAAVPMMGRFTFHLSEGELVPTMVFSALGSLVAGLYAAGIKDTSLRLQGLAAAGFGVSLVLYGAAPTPQWWAAVSFVTGAGATLFQVITTTTLQRCARPEMLGRVMALNSMGLLGTTPIGMLFVAWLSSSFGTRSPFLAGGAVVGVAGVIFVALTSRPRPMTENASALSRPHRG